MPKQSGAETLAMRNKIYMTVQESVIGAGTGNYNKLQNIPIVNLKGDTESLAADLSGLNPGHFNLSGFYKLEPNGQLEYRETPIDLYVLEEKLEENGELITKKVLYYIYARDGHLYIRMIVYVGSQVETDIDICLTRPLIYWEEEHDTSVTPSNPDPTDPNQNDPDPSNPDPNDPNQNDQDPNNQDPNNQDPNDPNQQGGG